MPRIVDDARWRALIAELNAYRATGMTPEKIMELMYIEPAPLPLSLYEDEKAPKRNA